MGPGNYVSGSFETWFGNLGGAICLRVNLVHASMRRDSANENGPSDAFE